MTQTISKTAAIKQARSEVRLYSQGRGWIISQYDEDARAWRQSRELHWYQASPMRRHRWTARAYELMGMSGDDAEFMADERPL